MCLSFKQNHEDSFVGGRISVVSPVEGSGDWRDPAERLTRQLSRDRYTVGDIFSNSGELRI